METRKLESAAETINEACEQLLANNDARLSAGAVSEDFHQRVCAKVATLRASLGFVVSLLESE